MITKEERLDLVADKMAEAILSGKPNIPTCFSLGIQTINRVIAIGDDLYTGCMIREWPLTIK